MTSFYLLFLCNQTKARLDFKHIKAMLSFWENTGNSKPYKSKLKVVSLPG